MVKVLFTLILFLYLVTGINAQGFNLPSKGVQVFNLKDSKSRNQATFYSEARFENITGLTNDVFGEVSFDLKDVKSTLKGEILVSTSSIKTGIEKRDEHLRSVSWLNSEKYPTIIYKIKEVERVDLIEDNQIKIVLLGEFSLRGKTKLVYASATIKYLLENEVTKTLMPGNLISIVARFDLNLSDFGISNSMIPNRVSDNIQIVANLVGPESK
ncbi:MAG: YceI family protein [Ignavibacteriales bacterium]|nr:YceI family protein [Ignavibacteriales bacterium]